MMQINFDRSVINPHPVHESVSGFDPDQCLILLSKLSLQGAW
jgi:hypothetical protein